MARTWQQDTEDTWTLRDEEGGILLAVTEHRPSSGQGEPTYRVTGGPGGEAQEFATFDAARSAADRMVDALDS